MTKKVLVLGNGPQINDIDFDRLDPKVITLGVNRIWLKHYPTYFFFHDIDILTELNNNPIKRAQLISNSICFSSDWINKGNESTPHWLRKYSRPNRRKFPDSVSNAIEIFGKSLLGGRISECTFYLAGINLKWQEPSHFWKEVDHSALNRNGREWYDIRFKKMFENIRNLKSIGYKMISVTTDSNLNKLMRSENIANLYTK